MKPFATTTELLPHQAAAVEKLLPIKVGAAFMEMGTGKSRTAIELALRRAAKIDQVVWFCPVSLKETVRQEILKHTDCDDIYMFNGKNDIKKVRWYIIGIESMSSSNRAAMMANNLMTERTFAIVDESTYIKGHYSMRTERITRFCRDTKYRLILTGTPLSQGVVDLFAQMRFLSPKILGYSSFYSFAANHLEYSEKYPGMIVRAHNTEWLASKIKPYVYQVTKEECMTLPGKLYETHYFGLTRDQQRYYDQAKWEMLDLVDMNDFQPYTIFRLFGVLQQIASGFWHRKASSRRDEIYFDMIEIDHSRIDTLLYAIEKIPDDAKIIIWAKFRYDIERILKALKEKYGESSCAAFYGDVPETKRRVEVEKFKSAARFFVATQSCGGHGLTLNEAHYVIFYNNGFKYSERLQAEDRCHRYGQEMPVTYIDIRGCCTIDERIHTALCNKESVAAGFRRQIDKIKDDKVKLKEYIKNL